MAGDSIKMQLHDDFLSRVLYATDASAYREFPLGVCYPHNDQDVVSIVKWASGNGVTLIPRAGGTSLAGQVVGSGLVVDVSRYMDKIVEINFEEQWAWLEPGVVLDHLNMEASKGGLFFGPETSTSNRCCMGGMVGNNSCGSHSLVYGSTRDHLLEAMVVLSDGSVAHFRDLTHAEFAQKQQLDGKEGEVYRFVASLLEDKELLERIEKEYPDPEVRRRNTGYALDELVASSYNLCKLLAGSEGTLAFVTAIKVKLVPLPPKYKMLLCAHCKSLDDAFLANLVALEHGPVAVELMDSNILELSKSNIGQNKNRFFIEGDPKAILITELVAGSEEQLAAKVSETENALLGSGLVYHCSRVTAKDAPRVWELRKAGLGLLSSMAGDAKPVSVIEDTAVAPSRLPAYMADFKNMLQRYSLECVFHAHIGTGELHLRPLLNLKKSGDVALFREIARETALLVKKHKGSLSGEHGDGRLRGEFIPLMYGERLYEVMKDVKHLFDPQGIFNKGKITDTPPMDSALRFIPDSVTREYETYFNYSAQGGWLRAIEQCNGSGDCRKSHLFGGTMCPSFRVTGQEADSTRGRANVLRELLTIPSTTRVFDQKEILEALDLCLSCKACKSECPSNVDMARYKAEFMQHHYDVCGTSFRSFMISRMSVVQSIGSWFPAVYNFFASNSVSSILLKKILRFAVQRDIPSLSRKSLRSLASASAPTLPRGGRKVYLFADEFTNFNEAEVGLAFINLMVRLGYEVVIPKHYESGRAAFSKGMLKRGRRLAIKNVNALKDVITGDSPLVGIEPSAILSFRDEYPDIVPAGMRNDAVKLAANCLLFDEFIMREFEAGRIDRRLFTKEHAKIVLHGHCHQKSMASVEASAKMLSIPLNYSVETLPTGCCGMAGSFGYEKEHYNISMEIGEQVLFPGLRKYPEGVIVSAPGTSCRQQIKDGTGKMALHPVEILATALLK